MPLVPPVTKAYLPVLLLCFIVLLFKSIFCPSFHSGCLPPFAGGVAAWALCHQPMLSGRHRFRYLLLSENGLYHPYGRSPSYPYKLCQSQLLFSVSVRLSFFACRYWESSAG